jgi:hypothetical protein
MKWRSAGSDHGAGGRRYFGKSADFFGDAFLRRDTTTLRLSSKRTMNLGSLYKSYALFFNGAGCVLNLFLLGLFLYAHRRYRNQPAFLVFAFGCFCASYTTAYLFAAGVQHEYSIALFPFQAWRILAYAYLVAEPLVFVSSFVGPVLLVRTYGRNPIQPPHDHTASPGGGDSVRIL